MSGLPRPQLPAGPVRDLFDALHDLHHRAGWPSLRAIASEVGCSHTTIAAAFAGPKPPRWGLTELIVEALGGDVEAYHRLWLAAGDPAPALSPRGSGPRQLPARVAGFTGRSDVLAELDRLLAEQQQDGGPVTAVLSGTAGVGKTALAVHWAHRVAGRYPDGQLYVNLRGYDPDRPVEPAEALAALLRSLDVPDAAIPAEVAERAARYRSELAGRRVLVLLDNARSAEQVRDLLPAGESAAVVTSRDSLAGLVARHGARRVELDLLPEPEAHELLRRLIGPRTDEDPDAAHTLAERCARLPLALRVAAEFAAARPGYPLRDLAADLGRERTRLDLLDAGGDAHTAVRSVLSWSYRGLDEQAARLFRLLGLHPGPDADPAAASALAGVDRRAAERMLAELARGHLVEHAAAGRVRMHDLLRAYAVELAEDEPDRELALDRLYDHLVAAVRGAVGMLRPYEGTPAGFADADEAGRWLDAELPGLPLAVRYAAEHGRPADAVRLAAAAASQLDLRGRYADGLAVHGAALLAARTDSERAVALNDLGAAYWRLGDFDRALDHHRRAASAADDPKELARAALGEGVVRMRLGEYAAARERIGQGLELSGEAGDRAGERAALHNLAVVLRWLGRPEEALDAYARALALSRELGHRRGEAAALNNRAVLNRLLGREEEAAADIGRCLDILRLLGDRSGEAIALDNLGVTLDRLGRHVEALGHHEQALAIHRATGYRVGEAEGLCSRGVSLTRLGRHTEALASIEASVALSRELGERTAEGTALTALGVLLDRLDRPAEARTALETARDLHAGIGYPTGEAEAVTALARLDERAGRPAEALAGRRRAYELAVQLGDRRGQAEAEKALRQAADR